MRTLIIFMVSSLLWSSSSLGQDGKKHIFDQTEKVQFKLDSTALLVEGMGFTEGKIIHNALAIICSQKTEHDYTFQSYLANGRKGEFKAELMDNIFYWYPNDEYEVHY
ncbi:hypothetical protein BH23BAC1_BH23BAC1_05410 [soil metagenome]